MYYVLCTYIYPLGNCYSHTTIYFMNSIVINMIFHCYLLVTLSMLLHVFKIAFANEPDVFKSIIKFLLCSAQFRISLSLSLYFKLFLSTKENNRMYINILTNEVRNKETNEQMHGRNIRSGQDLNQGRLDEKPIP